MCELFRIKIQNINGIIHIGKQIPQEILQVENKNHVYKVHVFFFYYFHLLRSVMLGMLSLDLCNLYNNNIYTPCRTSISDLQCAAILRIILQPL